MRTLPLSAALTTALALAGCVGASRPGIISPSAGAGDVPVARAVVEARSGSTLAGEATFLRSDKGVRLELTVTGVQPGTHAVHLHEKGDCSAPDASSAGPHWNPTTEDHGSWGKPPHHLGDIGNLEVGADGTGRLSFTTDRWTVGSGGPADIVGKALLVHASPDDFTSQPAGNAGGRIGCGVVAVAGSGS
jgi:Cu-Zn family superoxide dismutase